MNQEALAALTRIRATCDAEIAKLTEAVPDPLARSIGPGENLFAILAELPANARVTIDPVCNFAIPSDYQFAKPVHLVSGRPLEPGRVPSTQPGPTLLGQSIVSAPRVSFTGIRFFGSIRDRTILATDRDTVLDRCLIIGSPEGQRRGVLVNSPNVRILGCHIANIWHAPESQAIYGDNGTYDLWVEDCYLEAAGECVMFGGGDSIDEDHMPSDITIVNSTLTKPLNWRNKPHCTAKNLFELKCALKVTLRNCDLEHSWADGQVGFAIVLSVRNQDGRAPWSTIEDVVIDGNRIKHCASAIQILGRDDEPGHASGRMARVTFSGNTYDDIDPRAWATPETRGLQVYIKGGPKDLSFLNEQFSGQHLNSAFYFDGGGIEGLVVRDHHAMEGSYGLFKDGGTPGIKSLEDAAPGYQWANVTLVRTERSNHITYPDGTAVIVGP